MQIDKRESRSESVSCKSEENSLATAALRFAVEDINAREDVPFRLLFPRFERPVQFPLFSQFKQRTEWHLPS